MQTHTFWLASSTCRSALPYVLHDWFREPSKSWFELVSLQETTGSSRHSTIFQFHVACCN